MVHPNDVSGSTLGKPVGTIPPRSVRAAKVAEIPKQNPNATVTISTSTKTLTYVESIEKIERGPICGEETVEAWVLENEFLSIKGVLLGGNLMGFVDKETGEEYLWLNKEGAVGYGAGSSAFPLQRGLFLHGGIRMAAVTAEHGLYYDTDWDLDFEVCKNGNSASLIFSIQDTTQAREELKDGLSHKGFSSWGPKAMSNYPVTDAIFTFKVTLCKGEKFLRTECTVDNIRGDPIQAEAWMPQTWPITEDSQIISHQKKRRIKGGSGAYVTDSWVMKSMLKEKYVASDMGLDEDADLQQYNGSAPYKTKGKEGPKDGWVVSYPPSQLGPTEEMMKILPDYLWGKMDLNYPLQWPSADGGILYDYPYMDGNYHAVSFGDGRGAAYVSDEGNEQNPRFTKMWSWGRKHLFNREEAAKKDPPLAAGRPVTEYYEPWASAFNSAFFELYQFPPGKSSWEARFVPITGGLDPNKKQHELREVVDEAVKYAVRSLNYKLPKLTADFPESLENPRVVQGQESLTSIVGSEEGNSSLAAILRENSNVQVKTWDGSWVKSIHLPKASTVPKNSAIQVSVKSSYNVTVRYYGVNGWTTATCGYDESLILVANHGYWFADKAKPQFVQAASGLYVVKGQNNLDKLIGRDFCASDWLLQLWKEGRQVQIHTWNGAWIQRLVLPQASKVPSGSELRVTCASSFPVDIRYGPKTLHNVASGEDMVFTSAKNGWIVKSN